jgi:hypothetical protein
MGLECPTALRRSPATCSKLLIGHWRRRWGSKPLRSPLMRLGRCGYRRHPAGSRRVPTPPRPLAAIVGSLRARGVAATSSCASRNLDLFNFTWVAAIGRRILEGGCPNAVPEPQGSRRNLSRIARRRSLTHVLNGPSGMPRRISVSACNRLRPATMELTECLPSTSSSATAATS